MPTKKSTNKLRPRNAPGTEPTTGQTIAELMKPRTRPVVNLDSPDRRGMNPAFIRKAS